MDFKKQYNFIVIKLSIVIGKRTDKLDQTKKYRNCRNKPYDRLKIINLKAKAKMLIHLGKFEENFCQLDSGKKPQ